MSFIQVLKNSTIEKAMKQAYILISKELKVLDLKTFETKNVFMYHDTELHSL